LDPDGYTVTLQGDTASGTSSMTQPVAVNGTVTFESLQPGSYSLTLSGAIANCPIGGDNPRVVPVTAGHKADITFQVTCVQRVDVSGVWNFTEQFGSPLACNDTGSFVLTSNGDGLGGSDDLVGTCDLQDGSVDHVFSGPVSGSVVYSAASAVSVNLSVGGCSFTADVVGAPPDRLINGSIQCSSGTGTWTAVRGGGAVTSVTVSPATPSIVAGGTVQLRAVMIDASGSRRVGPAVTWTTDAPAVANVDTMGLVTGLAPGTATITAGVQGKSSAAAVGVEVVTFTAVQPGAFHSCGLAGGTAYCWGHGAYGQIGDGAKASRAAPVAVAGNLTLATISVGAVHTCGLTAGGAAYCWGLDAYGELGAGTPASQVCGTEGVQCSTTPLSVAGGHSYSSLGTGWGQNCGVQQGDSAAYCWGDGTYGALGNASTVSSRTPVPVSGNLKFVSIGAGNIFACGLTADSAAYCWGNNTFGQLGIGPGGPAVCAGEPCSTVPVLVSGGLKFTTLSVGYWHACGLTADSAAYCWGDNGDSQLGATSAETCSGLGAVLSCSTVPLPVDGALKFAQLNAGRFHSCGVVATGDGYCWGANTYGELGNGSPGAANPTPTLIAGGLSFAAVSAFGGWHSCGLTVAGVAYCWGVNAWGQLGIGAGAPEVCNQVPCSTTPMWVLGQASGPGTTPAGVARVQRGNTRSTALRLSPRLSSRLRSSTP